MATVAPPAVEAAPDRVPEELARGTPEPLRRDLETLLGPDRVMARASDLVRYASDASPYRLIPRVVVMAHDPDDVAKTLAYGRRTGVPVTFRAGGTSLNGQGQTDGILVDVRRHFTGLRILEDGAAVRVKPGTVLGHVNRALHRYGRRIGPDPASTDIATVGGVIANNSGGMRCGVVHDAYQTLRSLTFVLPSGTTIDTAAPDAAARFAEAEPELAAGLAEIRDEIRADAELAERIRRKFEIKNTTGYRLCAFLDADEPVEIFRRLLVGSEGTLGLVAEAVLETVPHGHHTATALIFFSGIDAAAAPVPGLVAAGASAVELMVNPTLIAASYALPGIPEAWGQLPPEGATLLVEMRADDLTQLDGLERAGLAALADHETAEPAAFTRDREETEIFWRVREGMQGIVGAVRPPGSTFIIEDVCVPPPDIADSARDIQALLGEHQFLTGVAGHASAGNLHFLLTPNFSEEEGRERYDSFMSGLVDLIVERYDGALKAEHGTGRSMAPYVEREWGEKATGLMWRIKELADPDGVLNPEVVLSRDPELHMRHLKSFPAIEEAGKANVCIECGFCEPVCPSRDLTTTPRQRIVLRREMARQPEGSAVRRALTEEYEYDAMDTCAADGSCALVCPLGIDTGELVKELRAASHSGGAERAALRAARHYGMAERAARTGLRAGGLAARVIGDGGVTAITRALRLPRWSPAMPRAAGTLPGTDREGAAAVYLPSCTNRVFGLSRRVGGGDPTSGAGGGQAGGGPLPVPAALVEASARAGLPVWIPPDVAGHCCGVPWSSKGYRDGKAEMTARTARALARWTDGGRCPVVIDASSCTHGLAGLAPEGVEVIDSVAWAHDHLLPRLEVRHPAGRATVHPPCSTRHLGQTATLQSLASALAAEAEVPLTATCCGFAGDRGLLYPELTAAATRDEAAEVTTTEFDAHVCANRTCEIGLEQATGRPYESAIQLLERVTRP